MMDANTPLWKAHDIGERLQDKIEALPGVERAFVHVDHETSHAPVRIFRYPTSDAVRSPFAHGAAPAAAEARHSAHARTR